MLILIAVCVTHVAWSCCYFMKDIYNVTLLWDLMTSCFLVDSFDDDGYIDGLSQIQIHSDKRTQVHGAQSSLVVTHPSTNQGRSASTAVKVPLS